MAKRYSPKLKFQVVLEVLSGEKTAGQVAKAYDVHPNSVSAWKRAFLEKGPEIFARDGWYYHWNEKVSYEKYGHLLPVLETIRRPKPGGIQSAIKATGKRVNLVAKMEDIEPFQVMYTELLRKDGVRPSYALRGAKDNPQMESFNSRFKTEGNSLFLDAATLAELDTVVEGREE